MGLDFCEGRLVQFRLPHAAPGEDGGNSTDGSHLDTEWIATNNSSVLRSYSVKVTDKMEYSFATYYTIGVKATLRGTSFYSAYLELLEEDGFLVRREYLGVVSGSGKWTVEINESYVSRATSAVVVVN